MKKLTIAPVRVSKHQASKKKFVHKNWKPSKGQLKDSIKSKIKVDKVAEVVPEEIKE
jgi:hypothetical protein